MSPIDPMEMCKTITGLDISSSRLPRELDSCLKRAATRVRSTNNFFSVAGSPRDGGAATQVFPSKEHDVFMISSSVVAGRPSTLIALAFFDCNQNRLRHSFGRGAPRDERKRPHPKNIFWSFLNFPRSGAMVSISKQLKTSFHGRPGSGVAQSIWKY